MITTKFYCDKCNEEIDKEEGEHYGYETDYAKTEIVILTCQNCNVKYKYWTNGSFYCEYEGVGFEE